MQFRIGVIVALSFFPLVVWAASPLSVRLTGERHRTEWNWVEYRVSLTNESGVPVLNPEIRYFAENSWIQYCENRENDAQCKGVKLGDFPKDSSLTTMVDYATWPFSVTSSVYSNGNKSVIRLKMNGLLYSGSHIDIHFRIYKNDWSRWDCSRDFSFQKRAETVESNYFMAVYDASHRLLWGYDPTDGKYLLDDILWLGRNENILIGAFDGDTGANVPAGRFWLLKDIPLSAKERMSLESEGIVRLDAGRVQNKNVYLFQSDSSVKKKMLDSLVAGFYNAFSANDTTPLSVEFRTEDLYKDESVCDSAGICQDQVSPRTEFDLNVSCWPDVSMESCKSIAVGCGGVQTEIDRNLVLSTHTKASIACLETNRDVRHIDVRREGAPTNDKGREAVNVARLQNSAAWKNALQASQPTVDWLSDAEYTGEGIVVGVYDTGIDWKISDFNEMSANGELVPRSYVGVSSLRGDHGSHVAGIVGGNGWNPDSAGYGQDGFRYRGVAPKVKFYSNNMYVSSQVGHVVNHSHTNGYEAKYESSSHSTDANLFQNWKKNCAGCDTLTKTSVYAAANNGSALAQYPNQRGYHSILANSKNSITVGNLASATGVRNSHSSMGPTWDGRIKPDVMAPGSRAEYRFGPDSPLTLLIDYIRIYRKGAAEPYFELNFLNDADLLERKLQRENCKYASVDPEENQKCFLAREINVPGLRYVDDPQASNGRALEWTENRTLSSEIYMNWRYELFSASPLDVQDGDEIEIRFRRMAGVIDYPTINGSVYFSPGDDFYDKLNGDYVYKMASFAWSLGGIGEGYQTTRLPWTAGALTSNYLRFGFSYDYGIVSSVPCVNSQECGTCYEEMSGTSMAAPFVSGVAALMYQKFQKQTGLPLKEFSMRNSTVKAILIHTAIDMEDSPQTHIVQNPDITAAENDGQLHYTPYGKGPDFATGWGKVDGAAALGFIADYDENTGLFDRFREVEIANGKEKRWNLYVPAGKPSLRTTLVWDDAPGLLDDATDSTSLNSKLMNDLDMYLVSPSGKFYFPWRLQPLPTDNIDASGNLTGLSGRSSGLENIRETDVLDAERFCGKNDELRDECFDHLNNVEVVDVDNPEKGTWQVVVRGKRVVQGNDSTGDAQVASLVSDFRLGESSCRIVHPYAPQDRLTCEYGLGDNLESFVTFSPLTFVGAGDSIYLYDEAGRLIGAYSGAGLSGKRIKVKGGKLKVVLDSDNDASQGYGFELSRIEKTPYSILPMLFEASKKAKKEE